MFGGQKEKLEMYLYGNQTLEHIVEVNFFCFISSFYGIEERKIQTEENLRKKVECTKDKVNKKKKCCNIFMFI